MFMEANLNKTGKGHIKYNTLPDSSIQEVYFLFHQHHFIGLSKRTCA